MNTKNLFLTVKNLLVPKTNEIKNVQAVQLWTVRWTSRYGPYSTNTREEMEAFTSEQDAQDFKTALKNAFRLIRQTDDTDVTMTKEA